MVIRDAQISDINKIFELAQSLSYNDTSLAEEGFLVSGYSEDNYEKFLGKSFFYVALIEEKIVGYRLAVEVGNPAHLQNYTSFHRVTWLSNELFEVDKLIYLAQSGTAVDYQRRGIASATLQHLINQNPNHSLFCAIAEKPLRNQASISFFEHKGFQRIGYFKPEKFKNISEYMSGRYALIKKK
ncbi:MAG: GNAT family N-acetyltransferase [Candidatus Marinimicrobia bacterium]|nr:GNAT family N-acetyltransferase [Candidatus Neomarinimicrobiota bacterium]